MIDAFLRCFRFIPGLYRVIVIISYVFRRFLARTWLENVHESPKMGLLKQGDEVAQAPGWCAFDNRVLLYAIKQHALSLDR